MRIDYCGMRKNLEVCEISDIRCAEISWTEKETGRAVKVIEHLDAAGWTVDVFADSCGDEDVYMAQIIVENHDEYEKVAAEYKAAKKLYK